MFVQRYEAFCGCLFRDTSLFVDDGHVQPPPPPPLTITNSYATLSRSISFKASRQFLEALLVRKAGQTPMLTGKH